MSSSRLPAISACLGIICRSFLAHAAPIDAALFPAAQTPISQDRQISVHMASGQLLQLASFRFTPKPGQSSHPNAVWCGLSLQSPGLAAQALVTIGKGEFETLSCDGLDQAGVVPPKGGWPRIGLIYRTRSPNHASRTPIVLIQNPESKAWAIDLSVENTFNALTQTVTLPVMRNALTH